MERVSERAPLLIGVTGSRFFDRLDAAADSAAAEVFAARLCDCFAWLDRRFEHCPKVLLCGAAFGVDLVAAEVALGQGPHWSVAALLALERTLFEEDFIPTPKELEGQWEKAAARGAKDRDAWMTAWQKRYAEHRMSFDRLLAAGRGRVLVRELPRLDGAAGSELSRASPTRDAGLRREHYEQVGQWIAESATVLFAHTSDRNGRSSGSSDGKRREAADGGTSRVVACRRAGRPDDAGLAVAARSRVLRRDWSEVLRSHGRDVWLVGSGPRRANEADPPVEILGRRSAFDRRDGWNPFDPTGDDGFEDEVGADATPTPLETLVVPSLIDRIHRRAEAFEAEADLDAKGKGSAPGWLRRPRIVMARFERWCDPAQPIAVSGGGPERDIRDLRRRLGDVQSRGKVRSERAFLALVLLFVASVGLFEFFADLFAVHRSLLICYVALVAISGTILTWAKVRHLQPMSEDCRTISEMLRVQDAWWAAGLGNRVDREHLQGVGRDLAHIPETVTTLLAWVWLNSGWLGDEPRRADGSLIVNWKRIRGTDLAPRLPLCVGKSDWIGGQWAYFTKRIPIRDVRAHRARVGSLFLFVAAWWLTLIVVALFKATRIVAVLNAAAPHLAACGTTATVGALLGAVSLAALPLWWRLRGASIQREIRFAQPPGSLSAAATVRTLMPPLGSAACLALLSFGATPTLTSVCNSVSHVETDGYRWIALVLIALLISVSGAWRYFSDKLALEAEALEYRDAQRRFRLGEYALAKDLSCQGSPADVGRAQGIVKELGRLALIENEAWLKSRRERPLTTV